MRRIISSKEGGLIVLSVFLFAVVQIIVMSVIDFLIAQYFPDLHSTQSLDNAKRTLDFIWFFGIAFITLIIAIISWIGVSDVTKIMEIRGELVGTINQADSALKQANKVLGETKDIREKNKQFSNKNEELFAWLEIREGMNIRNRVTAAQYLLNVDNIDSHWRYFKKIKESISEEKTAIGTIPLEEFGYWKQLEDLLIDLSTPKVRKISSGKCYNTTYEL